ncbi:fumarate reductase/succinate dehydrogenase flavo protein-like protein [Lindgomyces ingoldianus]|uniref:Fumarate reductase/succinate dehydrogenase flavo protein-like protein n=1 Tax=Lindgomyces ingoldianus TaxID=673940 RepID=A0ACB6QSD8_9PLEO|nr:fumarate reductase/succinate dehydrogenase flavo protein-like protein [Lindgomyces ingoldianus]KAF2469212.1 fumarate reductase/succinate dehydrogenase flavo protein-like protein [Lindgomyces ingoldianus]
MLFKRTQVGVYLSLAPLALNAVCLDVLTRDVIVVGGGASGAHAAVWLRDNGKSVAVIEKRNTLGGHTAVYHDPTTGRPINIGVQAWMEYLNTTSFPTRMGVSTNGSMAFGSVTTRYIDFRTGLPVAYTPPADSDKNAAIKKYLDLCEKYEGLLIPGFFNFPSPDKIPEDLTMNFGQFVDKYNLSAAVPRLYDATVMGVGDFMNVPTLYVMQASGVPMARGLLGLGRAIVPPSGNLHELYERVADFLGSDVLYSSTVSSSTRTDNRVSVIVRSANGTETKVTAKRLLIAIEPTLMNMAPFGMDEDEENVFRTLKYTTVYAGLVKHPSLQKGTAYSNIVLAAAPNNYSVYPSIAQVGKIGQQVGSNDLFSFTAVGTDKDNSESMKELVRKAVASMVAQGTIPDTNGTVNFEVFADHGAIHSRVSTEQLKEGFIQKQLVLQGKRSTWYTGAAFSSGYSTVLWAYNELLLPKMVEGL